MSDNETFKLGDVVELKSGGPKMTIRKIEGKFITSIFFSSGKLEHTQFNDFELAKQDSARPLILIQDSE